MPKTRCTTSTARASTAVNSRLSLLEVIAKVSAGHTVESGAGTATGGGACTVQHVYHLQLVQHVILIVSQMLM